ncbi:MAG: hypothetical protein Q9166_002566 [cf. Caloplaca sp. 2 TL-2023]
MAPSATSPSTAATTQSDTSLPLIPLTPLLNPSSPDHLSTCHALLSAFRTSGFLYLTSYTTLIPPSLISTVFTHSATFFARPQTQKDAVAVANAASNRGYLRMGREKVSLALTSEQVAQERAVSGEDMKETYDIGKEKEAGNPQPWPSDALEKDAVFRATMQDFFLKCAEMHKVVMRGIAVGMGLDAGFFDGYVDQSDNNLRLLHYPAVAPGGFEGGKRVRAGAHSDYGSMTFLFQDQRGGLQVEKADGSGWMDVEPREGCIVVNAGDVMARWSNDIIRSTKHRVVEPPFKGEKENIEGHPPRYSVAYFCNPNYDKWIEALPGTWENVEGGKKYPGINARDYLVSRLSATY